MTTNKYCDCAQGRWPCTCMPRYSMEQQRLSDAWDDATRARELRASAEWLKEICKCPGQIGVTDARFGDDFLSELDRVEKTRPGYWQRLATDKAKLFALKCAEFDALNARLQVYRGVALIGWAGFILVLLGV